MCRFGSREVDNGAEVPVFCSQTHFKEGEQPDSSASRLLLSISPQSVNDRVLKRGAEKLRRLTMPDAMLVHD
jgi:hypothetical protein